MSMNLVVLLYLVASICFIQALKGLSHPTTSIRGNVFGMSGMAIAVVTTAALIFEQAKLFGQVDPVQGLGWVLIGLVIGPGGKTIKGITEQTGCKIDISDDGLVTIAAIEAEKAEKARQIIFNMTRKLNEGDVYLGRVTRIIQIGAFVEILPGKEGMIHISQLAEGRVGKVEDEVAVGDEVVVKVREIDSKGRLNLTRLGIHPDDAARVRKEVTPG